MRLSPIVALPLLLIALPVLRGGEGSRKYLPLQQPEAPAAAKPNLEPLDFAPLSYYEGKCSRCHGEQGANYGSLLDKKTDAQLHDGIDMMAKGPGQAPLDEPQLQVMTEWHRALVEGQPFAHLMKIERGDKLTLSGEATPEAKVVLKSGEQKFEAKRDGAAWTIEAPGDFNLEAAQLSAEK